MLIIILKILKNNFLKIKNTDLEIFTNNKTQYIFSCRNHVYLLLLFKNFAHKLFHLPVDLNFSIKNILNKHNDFLVFFII